MWKSTYDIKLGPLPTNSKDTITHKVPGQIPDSAKEILVYAWIWTGDVPQQEAHFKIFVETNQVTNETDRRGNEAYFKLLAYPYKNSGIAYNSDNVWLPMPKDRDIKAVLNGKPMGTRSVSSGIEIIAYKD